jgi:imidazole glycerol-phosphate synthase subunit HisF
MILNTYATKRFINEIAEEIGSQSVIVSVDYEEEQDPSRIAAYIDHGQIPICELSKGIQDALDCNIGELLLNNISRDGLMNGYDINNIKQTAEMVNKKIPLIVLGGAGQRSDLQLAKNAGANGMAAGSLFVYKDKRRSVCVNYPSQS